jgi:hypothetical protein
MFGLYITSNGKVWQAHPGGGWVELAGPRPTLYRKRGYETWA